MAEKAVLRIGDKEYTFDIVEGTEGEKGIDIRELRSRTGLITLDSGYMNTGSCESSITFLDGENGILRYRGYPIEQLAEKSSFVEVTYLMIYGRLPNRQELQVFETNLTRHTMIPEYMRHFFDGFPRDAHPMATLSAAINTLSTFYQDMPDTQLSMELSIARLLAKAPTIAAMSYKKAISQPFIYPTNSLDFCSNFLKMMHAVPAEPYEVIPEMAKALDTLLVLHADHEQNCSTSTVRMVGSSRANLYASVSAGISALWGPLHGGANQAVIEMLEQIRQEGGNVKKYVDRVKNKEAGVRLMGFGHRVYKNFDPRAKIIKRECDLVLARMGLKDPLLDIAKQLEEVALSDDYFVSRKLYPNVDFYSGIIYRMLNIPADMFTVMFALGRFPGWIAQWKEMIEAKDSKIGRPRQIYTGPVKRDYVPIDRR